MKNRQFWVIVLCFLWLFGLLFVVNNNTQKQNLFEKSVMCRNLYWSVSENLKDRYTFSYAGMEKFVTDIHTFYSEKIDTCVIAYQIHWREDDNDSENDDNYMIESIQEVDGNYWLIMACHSKYDKDCYDKRNKNRLELQ